MKVSTTRTNTVHPSSAVAYQLFGRWHSDFVVYPKVVKAFKPQDWMPNAHNQVCLWKEAFIGWKCHVIQVLRAFDPSHIISWREFVVEVSNESQLLVGSLPNHIVPWKRSVLQGDLLDVTSM
jgi:hypothetical protein